MADDRRRRATSGERSTAPGEQDDPAGLGAALGQGVDTWWVFRHRRQVRSGVESVPPATSGGVLRVSLWLVALVAITAVGAIVAPGPTWLWFAVALVVMVGVGLWWDRRSSVTQRHSR